MSEFKPYREVSRTVEMRKLTQEDLDGIVESIGWIQVVKEGIPTTVMINIRPKDRANGSPKLGDMIARDPKNHHIQWVIPEQEFKANFETIEEEQGNQLHCPKCGNMNTEEYGTSALGLTIQLMKCEVCGHRWTF